MLHQTAIAGVVVLGLVAPATAESLTDAELAAFREQVQRCWNIPAGGETQTVSVQFDLARDGTVIGKPVIIAGGGTSGLQKAAAEAARRAVMRCAPYNLPQEKYAHWRNIVVHFDPSGLF
ncbi:MAG: TonB family protein [Rhizobiaceae bacterium]